MNKLKALKTHTKRIEHKIPMLSFKTSDEMTQIKRFVSTYYEPILTRIEIDMLKLSLNNQAAMDELLENSIEQKLRRSLY